VTRSTQALLRVTKRTLGCAGLLAAYLLLFSLIVDVAIVVVNRRVEAGAYRRPCHGRTFHQPYPVLVVSRSKGGNYTAVIVEHSQLEYYCSGLKDYSFIIPPDKQGGMSRQVARQKAAMPLMPPGRFEVRQLKDGRQAIEVVSISSWGRSEHYRYVSWYEASSRAIVPEYYSWIRDSSTFMAAVLCGIVPYTLAWLIGLAGYSRWRRRRSRLTSSELHGSALE